MKLKKETVSFPFLLLPKTQGCKANKAQQQGVTARESLLLIADQAHKHLPGRGNRHHLLLCCHLLKGWGDFTESSAILAGTGFRFPCGVMVWHRRFARGTPILGGSRHLLSDQDLQEQVSSGQFQHRFNFTEVRGIT